MCNPTRIWLQIAMLTLVAAAWAGSSAMAQSPWRWKFSAGEVLHYDVQQQSQTETKGAGKPTNASVKMNMRLTWKVEKVDEQGGATIQQTIDQLSTTMQVDKFDPVVYDSASQSSLSGPAKEIGESVKPILGAAFTVQLNARGEVLSVEPSDVVRESLGKAKSSDAFTADGLLRIARQASFVVPEQSVSPAATWDTANEIPSPLGQLAQTTRYTYAGPAARNGKPMEKVDFETQLKIKKAKDAAANVAIEENEQRGTVWFDAMAGRLAASESKQRLVTSRPYREMTIRVQSTTTATTALTDAP